MLHGMSVEELRKLTNASKRLDRARLDRDELIRSLRAQGATWDQLADAAGLSRTACIRIVKGQDAYR